MTSWTHLRPWFTPSEEAVRRWVVMQSLVTIVTLPLVLWQVYDLSEQRTGREISALWHSISGSISKAAAPRYVPFAGRPLTAELVDIESIDEWFGEYLIERAAAHPEIRAYIRRAAAEEDTDFYTAFQDMAEKVAELNPVSRSSRPSLRAPPSRR